MYSFFSSHYLLSLANALKLIGRQTAILFLSIASLVALAVAQPLGQLDNPLNTIVETRNQLHGMKSVLDCGNYELSAACQVYHATYCAPDGTFQGSADAWCDEHCHCKVLTPMNDGEKVALDGRTLPQDDIAHDMMNADNGANAGPPVSRREKRQGFEPDKDGSFSILQATLDCGEMTAGCSKFVECDGGGIPTVSSGGAGDSLEAIKCLTACRCIGTASFPK
ncbi:hypothetical protein F5Y15DRAFT_271975 [Xylariaceae sp. FL0016]|nr:hypothetical protein F5Y15DRAFT_271975 [Xylariaceae sp. FL0016]